MKVVSLVRCGPHVHRTAPEGLCGRDQARVLLGRCWVKPRKVRSSTGASEQRRLAVSPLTAANPAPMLLCSGGKDSCYNMVLCQQYGHEVGAGRQAGCPPAGLLLPFRWATPTCRLHQLAMQCAPPPTLTTCSARAPPSVALQIVALANLLPVAGEADDIDSWMYQTVGHQLIGAYAACTGLPLYRRSITGASADQVWSVPVCGRGCAVEWRMHSRAAARRAERQQQQHSRSPRLAAAVNSSAAPTRPHSHPGAACCSAWCTKTPKATRWKTCTACWPLCCSATPTSPPSPLAPSPRVRCWAALGSGHPPRHACTVVTTALVQAGSRCCGDRDGGSTRMCSGMG